MVRPARFEAVEEAKLMRFESRYVLPPTERRDEGVVEPMPKKLLAASTVRKLAEETAVAPV